jgi:hypothetical protein
MCHGHEMKWWKSEKTADKTAKETTRQDERAKAVPEKVVEEKELIPAE